MKIQIVGAGVVGQAQAYVAAQLGHQVVAFDTGVSRSEYATMVDRIESEADITFVCVPEGSVEEAVGNLVERHVEGLYVIKSSVPPGTTLRLEKKYGIHLCHNPEFLREATSFSDVMHPNFVVIGQCCAQHGNILRDFYLPLECPELVTQPTTSETVKITLNSYLATLISFWNEVDQISGLIGVDTGEVTSIARLDPRVSRYGTEYFGVRFGGKCLPKDLNQMIAASQNVGLRPSLLEAVRDFNQKLDISARCLS